MSKDFLKRRPRLALPYTILPGPDTVRLVAGEDFRYTLSGPQVEQWLPAFLGGLRGAEPLGQALARLDERHREAAVRLVARLYGERVLVDGPAEAAHAACLYRVLPDGNGPLRDHLGRTAYTGPAGATALPVLCQDRLDYEEALAFNRRCRADGTAWLWASTGAMSRGYVGPLLLPDAGPCLACLLGQFERLSPAPEIYRELRAHARAGRPIEPVPFPEEGVQILGALVLWKAAQASRRDPPAALYRLHVLDVEAMEVTAHRVFVDPECPECGGGAR
jgi:bacteriocin biosynthesis cyclodehydratase domain-containing protein